MKLIMEEAILLDGFVEQGMNESTGLEVKNYFISGIASTPEVRNRNNRWYSRQLWEAEVAAYQIQLQENTVNTLGEWQHPPRSTVDPSKAVIKIVELYMTPEGNVFIKAKILNNNSELTNQLKSLIDEGIKIGVSSRGVGSIGANGVVDEFKLITYDAVDIPSDYNAMLDGVVEGVQFLHGIAQDKEFKIHESGCIGECKLGSKKITEKLEPAKPAVEKLKETFNESKIETIKKEILDDLLKELKDQKRSKLEENVSNLIDKLNEFTSHKETI